MKGGTVRRIPGRATKGAPVKLGAPTTTENRELRRRKDATPAYYDYRGGWKGVGRNGAYWDRVRRGRRVHNRMARRSRQINRRLAAGDAP